MRTQLLNDLIFRAQKEEMGIIIKTTNQEKLIQDLIKCRKILGITNLIIAKPSSVEEVYIVKETVELDG